MQERVTRLRQRKEFEAVFASPQKTIVSSLFVVRVLGKADGPPRLGIVASRKALARAVDRNRAKRMVRESFRALWRELPPVDLVVQVRGAIEHATRAVARRELAESFRSIARAWVR